MRGIILWFLCKLHHTSFKLAMNAFLSSAYDLYLQNHQRLRQQNGDKLRQLKTVNNFKKTFSHEVQIHFIGAWYSIPCILFHITNWRYRDTVASIGVVKGMLLPLNDHVCFFRHALALDEGRVKFIPEYLSSPVKSTEHGLTKVTTNEDSDEVISDSRPNSRIASGMSETSSQIAMWRSAKEVWFSGSHSDV